jgi:hypothetical protein
MRAASRAAKNEKREDNQKPQSFPRKLESIPKPSAIR